MMMNWDEWIIVTLLIQSIKLLLSRSEKFLTDSWCSSRIATRTVQLEVGSVGSDGTAQSCCRNSHFDTRGGERGFLHRQEALGGGIGTVHRGRGARHERVSPEDGRAAQEEGGGTAHEGGATATAARRLSLSRRQHQHFRYINIT